MAKKIRVGVLYGGRSGEHEVSLRSAAAVLNAFDTTKYELVPIGITKTGQWLMGAGLLGLPSGDVADEAITLAPVPQGAQALGVDVVFPVMHGTFGEDGTVQGLLELAEVPYVGSGVLGSAVAMDKAVFKQVMAAAGLPILPWRLVLSKRWQTDPAGVLAEITAVLRYPIFTKPANLGSSVGISRCENEAELRAGLDEAARFDRRLVVEQGANIRELEVAVLGNDEPQASVVGEIRPRRDFYDYAAKYVSDDSELLIPAPLNEARSEVVRLLALQAYTAVDCRGLARVDLMLDKDTGDIFINEINTMPGFTEISMYPKLWEASGLAYADLLDELVSLALAEHEEKRALVRSFDG